jgi:hypothetical protein
LGATTLRLKLVLRVIGCNLVPDSFECDTLKIDEARISQFVLALAPHPTASIAIMLIKHTVKQQHHPKHNNARNHKQLDGNEPSTLHYNLVSAF